MATRLVFDQKDRIAQWVAYEIEFTADFGNCYAMGLEQDGEIIAGIVFHQYNGSNAVTHIAVRKPSKMFVKLLEHAADYAFNHCKLNRLTGMVADTNPMALKLDLHIGWEEEFVMKKAAADGSDLHVLVMWPDKCRWLKRS